MFIASSIETSGKKMFLSNALIKDIHKDDLIEIALHSMLPIKSSVKEYHACEKMWTHVMNKKLDDALMETNNKVDIYVVCVIKKMLLSASYL